MTGIETMHPVHILNKGKHPLPHYATEHSVGMATAYF